MFPLIVSAGCSDHIADAECSSRGFNPLGKFLLCANTGQIHAHLQCIAGESLQAYDSFSGDTSTGVGKSSTAVYTHIAGAMF